MFKFIYAWLSIILALVLLVLGFVVWWLIVPILVLSALAWVIYNALTESKD